MIRLRILETPVQGRHGAILKNSVQKSIEWKGQTLGILEMRRHYGNYLKGLPNIKEYRTKLVTLKEPEAIFSLLDDINKTYTGIDIQPRKINMGELAYSCG